MTPQGNFGNLTRGGGMMNVVNSISIWAGTNLSKIKGISSNFYGDINSNSEQLLGEVELTEEIEFVDGEIHNVKVEYESEILHVFVDNVNAEPLFSVPVNLSESLTLDNGAAYIGLAQETLFTDNYLEIMNWSLVSSSSTFS
jgi:hypothetical protein